jgi:hypothetical protein
MSPVYRGTERYAYTAESFCAARGHLSIWLGFVSFSTGRAMAQTVIHRILTAETRVKSRVSACEVRSGRSGTGTGFYPSISRFPCQHHSTNAPNLSLSTCRSFRTDRRVKPKSLPKGNALSKIEEQWMEKYLKFFVLKGLRKAGSLQSHMAIVDLATRTLCSTKINRPGISYVPHKL